MALKDALKTPPVVQTGVRSRIDIWREELDDSDRKIFDAAVRNAAWPTSKLWAALSDEGLSVGESAFRDWRRNTLRANT